MKLLTRSLFADNKDNFNDGYFGHYHQIFESYPRMGDAETLEVSKDTRISQQVLLPL